jgi:hypothetical protein
MAGSGDARAQFRALQAELEKQGIDPLSPEADEAIRDALKQMKQAASR